MSLIEILVHTTAAKELGWTLLHSLWEGAVIALALACGMCVLRSPRARYAVACLALAGMLLCFGLTFAHLMPQGNQGTAMVTRVIPLPPAGEDVMLQKSLRGSAADFLPWLTPFWMAGVLVFYLRTLASWMIVQRLRGTGVCCASNFWQKRISGLGARLRLNGPVKLLESCLTDVPIVVGYIRPVILIPVGLLTGLPAGQVESILLHELAHIRRYDYLVNVLQTCVESLLFYHPAAWWISRVIRTERENCCDDLVVALSGDPHQYAVALAALEQNRCTVREAMLAATGGNLVKRIHRLLYQPEGPRATLTPVISAAVLTITAAILLAGWQSKPAGDSRKPDDSAAPLLSAAPASKPPLGLLAQAQGVAATPAAPSPYWKWLNEDVPYIITDDERYAFKRLTTDEERNHFIEQFWLRRDPKHSTAENEFKLEHYRRIAYANERFATTKLLGWKSDRGRIYITWGPPDEIDSHPSGGLYERPPEEGGGLTSTFPFEQWRYRHIDRLGDNITIEFVDKSGVGDFRMTDDRHEKEITPDTLGQSSNRPMPQRAIFVSKEPGARAAVEVTPDRHIEVNLPIEFDAKEYSIIGRVLAPDGQISRLEFRSTVTLCKNSPGALGCLELPVFHSDLTLGKSPLAPGSYAFKAVVKELPGIGKDERYLAEKTYIVHFDVY